MGNQKQYNSSNKDESIIPMMWFGLIYGLISSLIIFIILRMRHEPQSPEFGQVDNLDSKRNIKIKLEPIPSEDDIEGEQFDNLTMINGIGPVISDALISNGIDSFLKLSKQKPQHIQEILLNQKVRLANPDSWPMQAKFAASNDWEGLKTYLNSLKKG